MRFVGTVHRSWNGTTEEMAALAADDISPRFDRVLLSGVRDVARAEPPAAWSEPRVRRHPELAGLRVDVEPTRLGVELRFRMPGHRD
jgi:hypothetical protein